MKHNGVFTIGERLLDNVKILCIKCNKVFNDSVREIVPVAVSAKGKPIIDIKIQEHYTQITSQDIHYYCIGCLNKENR